MSSATIGTEVNKIAATTTSPDKTLCHFIIEIVASGESQL